MEISTPSRGQGSRSIVAIVGRPEEAKERKETVLEEDVYVEARSLTSKLHTRIASEALRRR